MRRSTMLFAGLAVAITAVLAIIVAPGTVLAGGRAVPGAACDRTGRQTTIDTRHGRQTYRCEQRAGEDCPHWHWVYDPAVPRGQWTPRPAGPCPSCATPPATFPATPSAPPSARTSALVRDDVPAPAPAQAAALPITGGPDVFTLVGIAGALLFLGGSLVLLARNRHEPDEPPAATLATSTA